MAEIRETLTLVDRFSATINKYIQGTTRAAQSTRLAEGAASVYSRTMERLSSAANRVITPLRNNIERNRSLSSSAMGAASGVRQLAAALLGIQGVRGLVTLADNLTSITARLDMMNDGLQTTAELNQMIMDSANRTGGAYQETADLVGKLGVLAGNAFSSSAETVAFAEQVNKLMAIAGTSTYGAAAAMLQLTQAMSSGVLRGEELNSVLEQAPTIAQAIAEYLGVNVGQLREMASEGQITADVVKTALLSMADETNAKFEQMPLTFGRIGNRAANAFIAAFQPAVERFNAWLNSETGEKIVSGLQVAATAVGRVVGLIVDALTTVTDFLANNWDTVMSAAGIAAAAFAGYLMFVAASAIAANLPIIALVGVVLLLAMTLSNLGVTGGEVLTFLGQAFGTIGAVAYNAFAIIYNAVASVADFVANVFTEPVASVMKLFADLADTVLSVLSTIGGAIDALFGSNLQGAVEGWRSKLAANVDKQFGDKLNTHDRLELLNVADTAAKAGDFLGGLGDISFGGGTSGGGGISGLLEGINANTGATAGSAGAIEKSLGLAEEDLKSLVDVAEQRYVNRINLTSQTPVINLYGANTGDTQADARRMANMIRDVLLEQKSAGSSRSTSFAYSGVT